MVPSIYLLCFSSWQQEDYRKKIEVAVDVNFFRWATPAEFAAEAVGILCIVPTAVYTDSIALMGIRQKYPEKITVFATDEVVFETSRLKTAMYELLSQLRVMLPLQPAEEDECQFLYHANETLRQQLEETKQMIARLQQDMYAMEKEIPNQNAAINAIKNRPVQADK